MIRSYSQINQATTELGVKYGNYKAVSWLNEGHHDG